MTDENEIIISIGKLDYLFSNLRISFEELKKEVNKFKKLVLIPDIKIGKGKEKFIPEKFFRGFLKPLLEQKDVMNKDEILKEGLIQKRYDSSDTINRYLYLLEINGFIDSEKYKNKKYYFLKKIKYQVS